MSEQGSDIRSIVVSAVAEAMRPLEQRISELEVQFKAANTFVESVKAKSGMLGRFL